MAKYHIDLPKVREVMPRDYAELQSFRAKRIDHIAEYLGDNYGTGGKVNPVNVLSQFVNTVVRQLVGSDPRALIATFDRSLRSFAEAAQDDMNRRLKRMRYDEILASSVVDAMFLMGIRYRAITAPADSRFGGYYRVAGEVGICNIDFQDFCCDMSVRCIEDGEYQCHFYDAVFEDVRKCKLFNASMRKDLQPSEMTMFNEGGDRKIESLGMRNVGTYERYEEYIRMCQMYFPRYKTVITFAVDHDFDEPLLEQDWVGPECGPYEYLMLQKAPGKPLPKAPVMDLIDTHKSINHHARHLDNQASQQKSLLGFLDEEDANAVNQALQGAAVHLKNPQGVVPVNLFGVDQPLALWFASQRELFNEQSGTRALGGLSASAKTATQEKLIANSASELIQAWGGMVTRSAERDMEALGWFFWNNPHQKLESTYQLAGMPDVSIDRSVTPEERSIVPWSDMDLQIDAFSLQHVAPGQRAQILDEVYRNIVIPLADRFSQPGIGESLEKYLKLKSQYHNMPELLEVAEPLIGAQGANTTQPAEGYGEEPTQPGDQETIHTRVSQPGMTDKGNQQVLQQLMAGGKQPGGTGAKGLGQMAVA